MIERIHKKSLKRVRKLQKLLRSQKSSCQELVMVASSPFLIDDDGSPYPGKIQNIRLVHHYQVGREDMVLDEELEYIESEIEECQYTEDDLEKFSEWSGALIQVVEAHFKQYDINLAESLRWQKRLN